MLNDTVVAVTQRMQSGSTSGTVNWSKEPSSVNEREAFHKFVYVILRRRICDFYRLRSSNKNVSGLDDVGCIAAPDGCADHRILVKRMLGIVATSMHELTQEDRDLIALAGQGSEAPFHLSARERQRLSRARKKLREAIVAELGEDVLVLLNRDGDEYGTAT